jgi:hypothetical protein
MGHPRDSHRVYASSAIWLGTGDPVALIVRLDSEAGLFNRAVAVAMAVISLSVSCGRIFDVEPRIRGG